MTWSCQEGCPPTHICEHLEKLLPSASRQSVKAICMEDPEVLAKPPLTFEVCHTEESRFIKKLQSWGLKSWDIEMMCLRFVEGKTFREIAEEQHFTSESTCRYYYRVLVRHIKEKRNAKP